MTHRILRGRNMLALVLATALLSIGATVGTASAVTASFSNATPIAIPDNTQASPYPSSLNVSGFTGNVLKATATLRGLSHTCPDDLAVLLVGPSGANSILLSHYTNSATCNAADNLTLTFDQAAAGFLPDPPVSGTFKPTQGGMPDPFSPPAPGGPYPVDLNVFSGKLANGTWNLFIEDQAAFDMGSDSGGWSLTLSAPVNTLSAGKPKLNKKRGTAEIPVTVGDAGNVSLRGKGVKTASASKSKAVAGPGTVKLTVKPKGKTSQKLNSTGSAAVKVKITFTPNGGTPNAQTKKIKLKKTLG